MKRFALMLTLFLLLGAIFNVAVAWGLAWHWYPAYPSAYPGRWELKANTDEDAALWVRHARESWHTIPSKHSECIGIGARARYFRTYVSWTGMMTAEEAEEHQRHSGKYEIVCQEWGLPVYCCRFERWEDPVFGEMSDKTLTMATRTLPFCPIWPGFAINTVFYAAILWLPVAGLGALRRRRRIKRGLCPACAYPIGASDVCTECGRPTRSEGGVRMKA